MEFIEILPLIFNEQSKLYVLIERDIEEEEESMESEESNIQSQTFAINTKTGIDDALSGLINYFGRKGGFKSVLKKLQHKVPLTLRGIILILQSLSQIRGLLDKSMYNWIIQFKDILINHILNFNNEQLKSLNRNNINQLSEYLHNLLSVVLSKELVHETVETLKLDIAEKNFQSNSFEKRLLGLKSIISIIHGVSPKSIYSPSVIKMMWIKQDYLLDCLIKMNILRELLGEKMHVELLKRSGDIFKFFNDKKRLDESHVDMIWNCAAGKDVYTKTTIYNILKEIFSSFNQQLIHKLINLIQETPIQDYDSTLVSLILHLSKSLYQRNSKQDMEILGKEKFDDLKLLGITTFIFNIIQDDSGLSDELFHSVIEFTKSELLETNSLLFHDIKAIFMKFCISHLRKHQSVTQSLVLMRHILSLYRITVDKRYSNEINREDYISKLEAEQQLVELVFSDLSSYQTKVRKIISRSSPIKCDGNFIAPGTYYNYLENIQERLEFISFVKKNCQNSIHLTSIQITELWDSTISNSFCEKAKNFVLNWLSDCCENTLLDADVVQSLLTEKMSHFNLKKIGVEEFSCYKTYFFKTNQNDQKIIIVRPCNENNNNKSNDVTKSPMITQHHSKLIGLDGIWDIVLNAEDIEVVNMGITLITNLYNYYLSPRLAEDKLSYHNMFLERTFDFLNSTISSSDDSTNHDMNISRVVQLLQHFIYTCDLNQLNQEKLMLSLKEREKDHYKIIFSLKCDSERDTDKQLNITIPSNETLSALRIQMNQHLHLPSDKTVHFSVDTLPDLCEEDYSKTLPEVGYQYGMMMYYSEVKFNEIPAISTVDNSYKSPSLLLAENQRYFDLLFSLFDKENLFMSPITCEQLWNLLYHLPISDQEKSKFQSIQSEEDLFNLMSTASSYKLLYYLKIIQSIIQEEKQKSTILLQSSNNNSIPDNTPDDGSNVREQNNVNINQEDEEYSNINMHELTDISAEGEEEEGLCSKFIKFGGMNFILNILFEYEKLGILQKKCLDAILNLFSISSIRLDLVEKRSSQIENVINTLLKIVWTCTEENASTSACLEQSIITNSAQLLQYYFSINIVYTQVFYNFLKANPTFLRYCLLESSGNIRPILFKLIGNTCTFFGAQTECPLRKLVVTSLFDIINTIDPFSISCFEFFQSVQNLIAEEDVTGDYINLVIKEIINHPVIERNSNIDDIKDLVLINLLDLLSKMFHLYSSENEEAMNNSTSILYHEILQELFECLFELPAIKKQPRTNTSTSSSSSPSSSLIPPKCKSAESRKSAFNLLSILVTRVDTQNQLFAVELIEKNVLKFYRNLDLDYPTQGLEPVSSTSYLGIVNLGCICYMIALLQQLFMMPKFRAGIISLDQSIYKNAAEDDQFELDTEESEEYMHPQRKKNSKFDNLLYQMQLMFCYLQEGKKQCYDPTNFCKAHKDYDGNPTDVKIQMDVDEFFNMLCEKIENLLKPTPQEKLLNNIWAGLLCSQFICKECNYISEKDDPYFTVSLDIKNKPTIQDALALYVQGEYLEGDNAYMCTKCDKKVRALMRRCIKTLPNTLIIHLKRFEFNFDTMKKLKVDDRFEFPSTLDMFPYTKEGLAVNDREKPSNNTSTANDDSSINATPLEHVVATDNGDADDETLANEAQLMLYDLVGILVHSGTADSGHYYSFIKQRDTGEWLEFNDEVVSRFSEEYIANECFGGPHDKHPNSLHYQKSRSAYMLIYEKREDRPSSSSSSSSSSNHAMQIDHTSPENMVTSKKDFENFEVLMPFELYQKVWDENITFLRDKFVFNTLLFDFMLSFIRSFSLEFENIDVFVPFVMKYIFGVLSHSKKFAQIRDTSGVAIQKFLQVEESLYKVLEIMNEKSFKKFLFKTETVCVRNAASTYYTSVLEVLGPLEFSSYLPIDTVLTIEDYNQSRFTAVDNFTQLPEANTIPITQQTFIMLIRAWDNIPYYWKTFTQYFKLILHFARFHKAIRILYVELGIISKIRKFIIQSYSPPSALERKRGARRVLMGLKSGKQPIKVDAVVSILSVLIRSSAIRLNSGKEKRNDNHSDHNTNNNSNHNDGDNDKNNSNNRDVDLNDSDASDHSDTEGLSQEKPNSEDESDEEEDLANGDTNSNPFAFSTDQDDVQIPPSYFDNYDDAFQPLVSSGDYRDEVALIFQYWSYRSKVGTRRVMEIITRGINDAEISQLQSWFSIVLLYFDKVEDSLMQLRLDILVEGVHRSFEKFKKKYASYTRTLITQFKELLEELPQQVNDYVNQEYSQQLHDLNSWKSNK